MENSLVQEQNKKQAEDILDQSEVNIDNPQSSEIVKTEVDITIEDNTSHENLPSLTPEDRKFFEERAL